MSYTAKPVAQHVMLHDALIAAKRPIYEVRGGFRAQYLTLNISSPQFTLWLKTAADSVERNGGQEFGFVVFRGPNIANDVIRTAYSNIGDGPTRESTDTGAIVKDSIEKLKSLGQNHKIFLPFLFLHFHPPDNKVISPSDADLIANSATRTIAGLPRIDIIALIKKDGETAVIELLAYQQKEFKSPLVVKDSSITDTEKLIHPDNLDVLAEIGAYLHIARDIKNSQSMVVQVLEDNGFKAMAFAASREGVVKAEDAQAFGQKFAF